MATIERDGVSVYFDDRGEGVPIILGHSFLCSGEMWKHQVPALAERARVVNVDFRGHGRSGRVLKPFSLYDLVDDLVAVLDELEIGRAVWAGLSIGGMVALRAALTAPKRVAGLGIVDSHAGTELFVKKLKYRALGLGSRLFGFRPLLPAIMPLMFGPTSRRLKPELIAEWEEIIADQHVPSILCGLHAILSRDSVTDRLSEIEVPSVVIVGEQDAAIAPRFSEEIANGLADAELVVVTEAGHLSSLEQPEVVTEALLGLFERLR